MTDLPARRNKARIHATVGKWASFAAIIVAFAKDASADIAAALIVMWALFACTEIICRALEDHTHD